jgi:hypothetical protein
MGVARIDKHARRRLGAGVLLLGSLGGLALFLLLKPANQPHHHGDRSHPVEPRAISPTVTDDPRTIATIAHVQLPQATSFPLLRTPPEGLPLRVRTALRAPVFGVNWALAQRIPAPTHADYWAVPGNGYLCAVWQQDPSAANTICETNHQAKVHGLTTTSIRDFRGEPPQRLIVGLAPNNTRRVRIKTQGSETVLPVDEHGVFTLRDSLTAPPDQITLP